MKVVGITDESLFMDFLVGDSADKRNKAFEVLFNRLAKGVKSYIANRVNQEAVAEDMSQDIWLTLIKKRQNIGEHIQNDAKPFMLKPYIYAMARNAIIDHFRSPGRNTTELGESTEPSAEGADPEKSIIYIEFSNCVQNKLRRLSSNVVDAFSLTRDQRLNYSQAAGLIGISKETVKGYVQSALKEISACREVL